MLLSADSLTIILSKSIAIEPGLLELLQKVAGVRFFETQCSCIPIFN